jgi:polar amino acid transport system substrate-binding protein
MKSFFNVRRLVSFVLLVYPLSVYSIECDITYEVKSGDNLTSLARDAYGDRGRWDILYYSNRDVIGDNPSRINIGQPLWVPCLSESAGSEDRTRPSKAPTGKQIELLTASGYPPFTDPKLPNRGMATEIVSRALEMSDARYTIDWIDDWSAHLSPLLEKHKYVMGFPWLKPDCDRKDELSPEMAMRCNFLWSKDPIFRILVVLFKRSDNPENPSAPDQLHGKTLCRPAGYYTFDLEQQGLIPGDSIALRQPDKVDDCFDLLMEGKVDFVTLNMFTGEEAIRRMELTDFVESMEDLATTQGLYVVSHQTHPEGVIFMNRFNKGLSDLEKSGELSKIQSKHLANFYADK